MRPLSKESVQELSEKVAHLSSEMRTFNALLREEQRALCAEARAAKWSARKALAVKGAKIVGTVAYSTARGACKLVSWPFKRSKKAIDTADMARDVPTPKKPRRTRRARAAAPAAIEPVTA